MSLALPHVYTWSAPARIPPLFIVRARWQQVPLSLRRAVISVVPRESVLGNTLDRVVERLLRAGCEETAQDLLAWFCPTLIPCRAQSPLVRWLARQPGEMLTSAQWTLIQEARRGYSVTEIAMLYGVCPQTIHSWLVASPAALPPKVLDVPPPRPRKDRGPAPFWTPVRILAAMTAHVERYGPQVRSSTVWSALRLRPARHIVASTFTSWEAAWEHFPDVPSIPLGRPPRVR